MRQPYQGPSVLFEQIDRDGGRSWRKRTVVALPPPREDDAPVLDYLREAAGGVAVAGDVHAECPSGTEIDVCIDTLPAHPALPVGEVAKHRPRSNGDSP